MKILKYIFALLLISSGLNADTTYTVVGDCKGNVNGNLIKIQAGCTITVSGENGNTSPTAVTPATLTGDEGATISLVGTSSTDSDGTISTYSWRQVSGTPVSITNSTSATATFTAPSAGSVLVFYLVVTDNDGALTLAKTYFTSLVPAGNQDPIATVAADYSIAENLSASLDGSASMDPNGSIITYAWTQDSGTSVTINNSTASIANFTPPDVGSNTDLAFTLTVTDPQSATDTDSITVTITPVTAGTTYYVSNCLSGADSDCVAGSDSNDGLTMANAWQTYEKARANFSSLDGDDQILFAKGGAFSASGGRWNNYNSTASSPIIIAEYTPTWGSGDEDIPLLIASGQYDNGFDFTDGGNANAEAGYTFRNLEIQCTFGASANGSGFWMYNDVDDITISGVTVDGCRVGINSASSAACEGGDSACNGVNDRLTVSNSTVINSLQQGYLGHADDLVIENSTFTNNGGGTNKDHNIYYSGGNDSRISGNTLFQSSLDGSGLCQGTSLVVHGNTDNLLIENNTVYEALTKAGGGCWGISVTTGYGFGETFTNITIRGNTVQNVGNQSIGVNACQTCVIENNIIEQAQTGFYSYGIIAPSLAIGSGDGGQDNITIKNNTFTMAGTQDSTFITVHTEGTGMIVKDNTGTNNSSGTMTCTALGSGPTFTDTTGNTCN